MTKKERNSKHKRLKSEVILNYLNSKKEPVTTRAIAQVLGRSSKQGVADTEKLLEQLHNQNKITQVRRHRWVIPDASLEVIGTVVGHFDGHGFVLPEQGGEKIFLRAHDMREVLHNDTVKVKITGRGSGKDKKHNKRFGQILDVVKRGNSKIIGRFYHEQGLYFVVPQDQRISQDIFITAENLPKEIPENGQVVICEINRQPSKHFQPVGDVIEVLGDYLAPGMEIEIAINEHQIPNEWPDAIALESDKFPESVDGNQFPERKDLRDLPLVTIDGEDARDFDDAVYCEPLDNGGYRLVVAIADVSHYVKTHSAIDAEAWQRGNSVYFPRQVIPMLPTVLSNGLCSLNPQVDRLCMVCDMQFSSAGIRQNYEFYQAVMHSHARLTYTQVADFLEPENQSNNDSSAETTSEKTRSPEIDPTLHTPLTNLAELADILGKNRRKAGSIDLEIAEPVIIFNENRKIETVIARERNVAHKLIEECMLVANISAADKLENSELAGIYRSHEQPDEEKVAEMRQFIRQFDLMMTGGDEPQPKDYSRLIERLEDPVTIRVVHQALLRSFKQAIYSEENQGHFALSFDSYTHFTSPIRRYADLHVHRQIKRLLKDPAAKDDDAAFARALATAEQTSMTERRAEKASRAVIQWLKCEFIQHKVGESVWGIINTVVDFGLFVELDDVYVEGLVHIASLGQDYYRFDQERRVLQGETSGKTYKAGQRVQIQIVRVDLEQRRIDFELVESRQARKSSRNGKHNRSGKSGGAFSKKGKEANKKKPKTKRKSKKKGSNKGAKK